jgi:peptide/nickel transport system permease protein
MVGRTVLRRLSGLPILLLLVTMATFGLTLLLPGDPAQAVAGNEATPEQVQLAREALHLDKPVPERYVNWLASVAHGDFGKSAVTSRSVTDELTKRLPITASIGAIAMLIAIVLGTTVGLIQALFANRFPDRALLTVISVGLAVPNFWLATMLVALFAVELQWLPAIGYTSFGDGPGEWFRHIILPVSTLAVFPIAEIARQIRTGLVGVLDRGYIRAARARGLSSTRLIGKHALKNASGPAVTIIGLRIGYLFAGSVIVERIFSVPGLGAYALQAISNRDVPAIQAIVLLSAVVVIATNLLVDICYVLLNPKVRLS